MASEQFSSVDLTTGGDQAEDSQEESPKLSFMGKVKAKAQKLKTKLKNHGNEDSYDESDATEVDDDGKENQYVTPTTPEGATDFPVPRRPRGATDPKSEDGPLSAANTGQSAYGMDSENTDGKSFPVDPSTVKGDEAPGNQRELPTNDSDVKSDPQQEEVLSKSGDQDSELPPSSMESEDLVQKNDGLVESSQPSEDSLMSHPVEQDQGISENAQSPTAPETVDSETRNTSDPELADRSDTNLGGEGFAADTAGAQTDEDLNTPEATDDAINSGEPKPEMNQGIDNVDDGNVDESKDTATSEMGADEGAVDGNNQAANQLGDADQALPSDEKPVSPETDDAAPQAQDASPQESAPDQGKGSAGSYTESIASLPGMLTSKLGFGGGSTPTDTPTSDGASNEAATRKDTPYPDQPAAAAPSGLMDRMSGLATSLFGGGSKPTTTPTDGEKPSS